MNTTEGYIIDIETIRGKNHDLALEPFIGGLRGKTKRGSEEDKYEVALGKAALTPVASRVIWIGMRWVTFDPVDGWVWHEKQDAHLYHADEKEILQRFAQFISKLRSTTPYGKKPMFITFNGRGFDFPFLMYRAAMHGVPLWLPSHRYNTNDGHYDLFLHLNDISLLSNIDSSLQMIGLKKWSAHFNLDNKLSIANGEINLEKLWEKGDVEAIKAYVTTDLSNTFILWKNFAASMGMLGEQGEIELPSKR